MQIHRTNAPVSRVVGAAPPSAETVKAAQQTFERVKAAVLSNNFTAFRAEYASSLSMQSVASQFDFLKWMGVADWYISGLDTGWQKGTYTTILENAPITTLADLTREGDAIKMIDIAWIPPSAKRERR